MIDDVIIEPSRSTWNSPIVVVKKKNQFLLLLYRFQKGK